MSESEQSTGGDQAGPLAGQRLAAARKAREISIFEIAKELHLDEHKVQALEENRFDVLGAPVFAKGHMRKYAQLVGVSIDDVMTDYYAMNRAAGAPPVVGVSRKPQHALARGHWPIIIGLIALAALAYLLWPNSSEEERASDEGAGELQPQPSAVAPDVVSPDPLPTVTEPPADSGSGDDTADLAAPEPESVSESAGESSAPVRETPAPVAEPAVRADSRTGGVGEVALSMRFSGDCWTEITDATGARLFFDLGRSGRTIAVSGTPPLRVLFGDSDNVELTVDGRDYPIVAAVRRGRTARFTIYGR